MVEHWSVVSVLRWDEILRAVLRGKKSVQLSIESGRIFA